MPKLGMRHLGAARLSGTLRQVVAVGCGAGAGTGVGSGSERSVVIGWVYFGVGRGWVRVRIHGDAVGLMVMVRFVAGYW